MGRHIFATFSGSRGQKFPFSIFRLTPTMRTQPFLRDHESHCIAFDRAGQIVCSSRHDEKVYRVARQWNYVAPTPRDGSRDRHAFDRAENLSLGDRNGTILKWPRPSDIRVRYFGVQCFRVSHGIWTKWRLVRDRSNNFHLRCGL